MNELERERDAFLADVRNREQERRNNVNDEKRDAYHAEMRKRDRERRNNMNDEERYAFLAEMRNSLLIYRLASAC